MHTPGNHKQRGAVLIVSLLFLAVLTILGVNAMNTTMMEEKMAGNAVDRDLALQAAEAALRAGERDVTNNKDAIIATICNGGTAGCWYDPGTATSPTRPGAGDNPGDGCPNGYCTPREHDSAYDGAVNKVCTEANHIPNRWESCPAGSAAVGNNLNVWTDASGLYQEYSDTTVLATGVFQAPRYIVEYMGHRPAGPAPDGSTGGDLSACDTDNSLDISGGWYVDPAENDDVQSQTWPFCESDPAYFRVTAMGYGRKANTRIMLQSTFLVP